MDIQFDLPDFLIKLKDYTSDNDRFRLYGLLRQHLINGLTLADTLNIPKSLFDQNKINIHDFDIFIQTFDEMNCHGAVTQLEGRLTF